MAGKIYITETDRDRIRKLIEEELDIGHRMSSSIKTLEREINSATIVPSRQLPRNVISMNSRALLCLNGRNVEVALVYPQDADWAAGKLSVFSPIGTAILGYGEGDRVTWDVPSGTTEIHISKILYQPEAAGDYHL